MGMTGGMHHIPVQMAKGLAGMAIERGGDVAAEKANKGDGYNQIYERDGGFYTREANPDYITYEPRKEYRGIFGKILNKVMGDHVAKKNEGVHPFIYTAITNPYAPAEEEIAEAVGDVPVEFAEGSFVPTPEGSVGTILPVEDDYSTRLRPGIPAPIQTVYPQPQPGQIVYDPYTMPCLLYTSDAADE